MENIKRMTLSEFCKIPDDKKNIGLCFHVVAQAGEALGSVPIHNRIKSMCQLAIERSNIAIKYVPADNLDQDMCLMAVRKAPWNIEYVPRHFINDEMRDIVNNDPGYKMLQKYL